MKMSSKIQPSSRDKQPLMQVIPAPLAESLYAAKGDDDLMSQEPRRASSTIKFNRLWVNNIGAAKAAWGKLTQSELIQSEGREQTLISLISRRYNISTVSAQQQVHRFFQQYI